jgi:NTE family protein
MASHPYTKLVFEGGGVKGLAYVGALQAVEDAGLRPQVTAAAGASAGAISAALIALGYSAADLRSALMGIDLTTFEDGRLTGPLRVLRKFGFFKGDAFLQWMQQRVHDKLGDKDATFATLRARTGFDLRVVACDLSRRTAVEFSAAKSASVPVALAVRMSMSIPLFFAAVPYRGELYVDGGTMWNYPISIFDVDDEDKATLGFHLGRKGSGPPPAHPVGNWIEYGQALYESLVSVQSYLMERNPEDAARTVFIDDLGVNPVDFNISKAQKEALIQSGFDATTAFLAGPGA